MSVASGSIVKNSKPFSGGATAKPGGAKKVRVQVTGVPKAGEKFNLTMGEANFGYSGAPTPPVSFALTLGHKVYACGGTLLQFSAIDRPDDWDSEYGLGAGFINMFNAFAGGEKLTALSVYAGRLAILARNAIQIWSMDVDPARNAQNQVLDKIGTLSPKSVVQAGDVDVYFLHDSGIRSLRSRDINNVAFSSDIGNPIDDLVVADIRALGDAAGDSIGLIEPTDGRYWLFMGNKVYVLSAFSHSKVTAWSTYAPGFTARSAIARRGRVWVRSTDDDLYVYGGQDGNTYDDCLVEGDLPYLSTGTPATMKDFTAFDAVVEGEWSFALGTNPEAPDARDDIGRLWAPSFDMQRIPIEASGTHFALQFKNQSPGYARLSNVIMHYRPYEAG